MRVRTGCVMGQHVLWPCHTGCDAGTNLSGLVQDLLREPDMFVRNLILSTLNFFSGAKLRGSCRPKPPGILDFQQVLLFLLYIFTMTTP